MIYDGYNSSASKIRRKLHVMYCRKPGCQLRWVRRLFDSSGEEQRGARCGEHSLGLRRRELPPNARKCPVCEAELRYPKEIFEIGGHRYDPPLLRVICLNPDNKDHSPKIRHQIGLPAGNRNGLTFHYDQKHSKFVQIYHKALKKGHPIVNCRAHGRMRATTITDSARVPKDVYSKLGSTFPIYRVRCRFGDRGFWISTDQKTKIPYEVRHRKRTRVSSEVAQ